MDLVGNPDFVKLAESYGCKAFRIKTERRRARGARRRRWPGTRGPVVIDAEVAKEDNVFPMIPAGASIQDMILGPPAQGARDEPRRNGAT